MSQNNVDYSQNPTGAELMDDYLAAVLANALTSNSGIQRPVYARPGTFWVDTSVTPWLLKMYNGTKDVLFGEIGTDANGNFIVVNAANLDLSNLSQTGEAKFNSKADVSSLSPVATSGDYNDLSNKPTILVDEVGTVKAFAGATPPSGWLFCDGSAISRTTYAELFAVIGTTYGGGDGSTTFNLPNIKMIGGQINVDVYGDGVHTLGLYTKNGNDVYYGGLVCSTWDQHGYLWPNINAKGTAIGSPVTALGNIGMGAGLTIGLAEDISGIIGSGNINTASNQAFGIIKY